MPIAGSNDRQAKLLGLYARISERPDYHLRRSILDDSDPKVDVEYSALRCDLDPGRIVTARMALHDSSELHRTRFYIHALLLFENLRGQLYDLYQVSEFQIDDVGFQTRGTSLRRYQKTRNAQFSSLSQPRSDRHLYTRSEAAALLAALPE